MKYILTLLIFTVSALHSSDSIEVSGRVQSSDGVPVEGAHIYTQASGAISNALGEFSLTAHPREIVTVSHISYATQRVPIDDIGETITLHPQSVRVSEIQVVDGMQLKSLMESIGVSTVLPVDAELSGHNHLEDIVSMVPNLNSSGGTSRARYFQVRGIGELSQFAGEGAPHFYVGYVIDDINLSGMGSAGTLNDLRQIDVFKGPHSTVFGANAMAGTINLASNDPTPFFDYGASVSSGTDSYISSSTFYSGPIVRNLYHRLSVQTTKSDGFRRNLHHNITNSNKRDEFSVRYKLLFTPSNALAVKAAYHHADMDNGYDVWTVDNNGFETQSDYLGRDSQRMDAVSINAEYKINSDLRATYIHSSLKSDVVYSYDGDWGNQQMWEDEYSWTESSGAFDFADEGLFLWGYYPYTFTDSTNRARTNKTHELRVTLKNLSAGVYHSQLNEIDSRFGWLFGGSADYMGSEFNIISTAGYLSSRFTLTDKIKLGLLARVESNTVKDMLSSSFYGYEAGEFEHELTSTLFGGRLELSYALSDNLLYSASASKGYKSQGVNQSINIGQVDDLPIELRDYGQEDAYNAEAGMRYEDEDKSISVSAFYMHRVNPQVRLSYQLNPSDPASFDFYTVNAESGRSYGIEGEMKMMIFERLHFYDSFAILKSHIDSYQFLGSTIGNREQAHAPEFSASAGFEYSHQSGAYLRIEHSVMLDFYYEDQYDFKSNPYQLVNGSLGFSRGKMQISVWMKNILDERHVMRGYYFSLEPPPNEPPHFFRKSYTSYGDPRHIGVTLSYGI